MSCKWVASDRPRVVADRHGYDCAGEECAGCAPCEETHCRICRREHADGTCAECMAVTRETLRGIGRMCDALPEEVEHRGVEGEAMVLLGPAADPEARGWVEAAYIAGRLPEGWIEAAHGKDCPLLSHEPCTGCAGGELHPYTVLATWDMVVRDALDHEEPLGRITVASAIEYLDRQLTYLGGFDEMPFEDMARDLRQCATYLENVLHDGEQIDRGAPCMKCRVPLVREWGKLAAADGWRCPKCREWRNDSDYRLNVADLHRAEADWLTDQEMDLRTGVKAGTVRKWAERGLVRKKLDSGRRVYAVADVEELARDRGMLSA